MPTFFYLFVKALAEELRDDLIVIAVGDDDELSVRIRVYIKGVVPERGMLPFSKVFDGGVAFFRVGKSARAVREPFG